MHEAAFVLGSEWHDLINRKAAGQERLTVRQIRDWIKDEQPGLPADIQNLVVTCYAIQADKAWLRAGQPVPMPHSVLDVADDMILRGQELPAEDEFDLASERAAGIFRATRQPVRSTRSVQALAHAVNDKVRDSRPFVEALAAELDKHAKTLGLDDRQPRAVTSRIVTGLLARLSAAPDATATLRQLATADLPRENAIYAAHLASAGNSQTRCAAATGRSSTISPRVLMVIAIVTQSPL